MDAVFYGPKVRGYGRMVESSASYNMSNPNCRIVPTLGRLLVFVFIAVFFFQIDVASAVSCAARSNATCAFEKECQWSDSSNACVNSLPCVLESSQADCSQNTWGCTWSNGKCFSASRLTLPKPQCETKLTSPICNQDKTCIWKSSSNTCARRPTIILSVADDLGWYDVSWKNPRSRTPVLERLKRQGIELDRHYSSRFCAPTRSMLLTGRMAWKIGMQTDLNAVPTSSLRCAAARDTPLLPELLKNTGGYSTFGFGKWHLGSHSDAVVPTARGFDSFIGYYLGNMDRNAPPKQFWQNDCTCPGVYKATCSLYNRRIKMVCTNSRMMVNETSPTDVKVFDSGSIQAETTDLFLASHVVDTINNVNVNSPLFLYVAWTAPHEPEYAPQRYVDAITNQNMTIGTDARLRRFCSANKRIVHLGMITVMDEGHRMMLEALDRTGRYEDTVFVFLSDNGANNPSWATKTKLQFCRGGTNYPLRGGKYSWFEGGIRTIAFVHSFNFIPVASRGSLYRDIVSANDWKVTLLRASGYVANSEERELDVDLWPGFSKSGSPEEMNTTRTELAAQVWLEQGRYVILFRYQGSLFKVLQGYPYAGLGPGNVGQPTVGYAHSEIDQPWELPSSEMNVSLSSGFSTRYNCRPFCLFNVDEDPQEFKDLSVVETNGAMVVAKQLIQSYKSQAVRFNQSGYCDAYYYPLDKLNVMDPNGIRYARSCQAYLPWLYANGTRKAMVACPPSQ